MQHLKTNNLEVPSEPSRPHNYLSNLILKACLMETVPETVTTTFTPALGKQQSAFCF